MPGPTRIVEDAECLILAGGEGRRLCSSKLLLEVEGRPIISRVAEVARSVFGRVLLVTNTPERYRFLGLPHIGDEETGLGPLMGIYSGLKAVNADKAFVCAADMPFLDAGFVRAVVAESRDHDVVVPFPGGLPEYLHAVYRVRCLPVLKRQIEGRRFRLDLLRGLLDVRVLDDGWFREHGFERMAARAFANINTQEDYRTWRN